MIRHKPVRLDGPGLCSNQVSLEYITKFGIGDITLSVVTHSLTELSTA
jgi:hypothetical protein